MVATEAPEGRFVVAGGSIAGMATALALARAGADVLMVERDAIPPAADPEQAFAMERPGVPQSHFLHAFLARMVHVLEARYPDVLAGLLEAGARLAGPPLDDLADVRMLLARRSTVEWVFRRAVEAERRVVQVRGRSVVGLEGGHGRVTGARLDDGSREEGAVVAATGRRPDVGAWLADVGVRIEEQLVESQLVYITRWYRAPDFTTPHVGLIRDLGFMSYLVVPADAGTLAVAVGLPPDDRELRAGLLDDGGFDRVAGRLPGLGEDLAAPSVQPLRSSRPMAGLVNRLRRFTDGAGEPLVTGFHAVGDAHTCTNPAYGRGCSLALVGASLLTDAVLAHPREPQSAARVYESGCRAEIEPWFHSSVMMDQARLAARRQEHRPTPARGDGPPDILAVLAAAGAGLIDDPVVIGGFARLLHLLVTPQRLFEDAEFTGRLLQLVSNPPEMPAGRPGPSRQELLEAASAAA